MIEPALSHFGCWLPAQLFAFLRLMDAEATTPSPDSGRPYGLYDYGRHARSDISRPQNEVEWSRRLAALLTEFGLSAGNEVRYPLANGSSGGRQRCDLVLTLHEARQLRVEVKGAWRSYWGGNSKIYRSYLLHPLVPGLDESKTHTVPLDLMKLASLAPPQAHYIGELLVGFDTPADSMDDDVATLVRLAGLGTWNSATDSWMSPTTPGQRVRCWFWWRPADGWRLPVPTA